LPPHEISKPKKMVEKVVGLVVASIFITAVIVGIGVYMWQKNSMKIELMQLQSQNRILRINNGTLPNFPPSPTPTVTPNPTDQPEPIIIYNTGMFKGSVNGLDISFKYPSNWYYQPEWNVLLFYVNGKDFIVEEGVEWPISISVDANKDGSSAMQYAQMHKQELEKNSFPVTVTERTVAGIPAVETSDYLGKAVWIVKGDKLLMVSSTENGNPEDARFIAPVFEQIVSSLTFTK